MAEGSPDLPSPAGLSEWIGAIPSFLNAGGHLEPLLLQLEAGAWLPPRPEGVALQDLTGDGWTDLAIALQDPTAQRVNPPGILLILTCAGDAFHLTYTSPLTDDRGAPQIRFAQDLTGDGPAEILVGRQTCGAHTCFEALEVLQWQGFSFENVLVGLSDDLPSPVVALAGPQPDGSFDIAVTGTGIGSVGAGPYQPRTRTWTWDPAAGLFAVAGEAVAPTKYRIHLLHAADAAFDAGDYPAALDLYRQTAIDDSLDDWIGGPDAGHPVRAYATYRRILTYLLLADLGDAQVVYGILQGSYPPGSIGHAYAQLGTVFWDTFQATGSLDDACRAAQGYAAAHSTEILDPLAYGYANPTYTAEDVCPSTP